MRGQHIGEVNDVQAISTRASLDGGTPFSSLWDLLGRQVLGLGPKAVQTIEGAVESEIGAPRAGGA